MSARWRATATGRSWYRRGRIRRRHGRSSTASRILLLRSGRTGPKAGCERNGFIYGEVLDKKCKECGMKWSFRVPVWLYPWRVCTLHSRSCCSRSETDMFYSGWRAGFETSVLHSVRTGATALAFARKGAVRKQHCSPHRRVLPFDGPGQTSF